MRKKWKELLEEYGKIAILIYLLIFAVTIVIFSVLLQVGLKENLSIKNASTSRNEEC